MYACWLDQTARDDFGDLLIPTGVYYKASCAHIMAHYSFICMLNLTSPGQLSALSLWWPHTPTLPNNARLGQGIHSCRMRSPVRRRGSRGRSPLPPIRAGQRRPSDLRIDENTRALFLQVCCVVLLLPVPSVLRSNPTIQSVSVVWHLAPHESIVLLACTAVPAWDFVQCPA